MIISDHSQSQVEWSIPIINWCEQIQILLYIFLLKPKKSSSNCVPISYFNFIYYDILWLNTQIVFVYKLRNWKQDKNIECILIQWVPINMGRKRRLFIIFKYSSVDTPIALRKEKPVHNKLLSIYILQCIFWIFRGHPSIPMFKLGLTVSA